MKVLLVGGTGTISTGVEKVVIEERGYELYVMNRGSQRSLERMHPEAHLLKADYNDEESVKAALGDLHFDTIVDFRIQGVADQEKAVRLFDGRTDQYILISSGTVYRKPLEKYLVTEYTGDNNEVFGYPQIEKLRFSCRVVTLAGSSSGQACPRGCPTVIDFG